jgi:hypothetical protein
VVGDRVVQILSWRCLSQRQGNIVRMVLWIDVGTVRGGAAVDGSARVCCAVRARQRECRVGHGGRRVGEGIPEMGDR